MLLQGQIGPNGTASADGVNPPLRQGKQQDLIVSECHGRFYEQNYRGNMFSFGISNTALVAANAIATGVTATAQPIIGLYNPTNSGVNLVILQASLVISTVANSAVNPGGFMWVGSAGNNAISTGSVPISTKTLLASGSAARAFAVSTALTGLTTNLATIKGSSLTAFNAAGAVTAVSIPQGASLEQVDGSIIVPPGGVVALMNQLSTTTCNVTVGISWEEVPV